MTVTPTMTVKAQGTINKRARDATGMKPGSRINVTVENGKVVLTPASKGAKSPFEKIRGTLKDTMSTDEIMKLLRGD